MNADHAKMAKLATKVDQGRRKLITYLKEEVSPEALGVAQDAVGLPAFRRKLNNYSGDISTTMLLKITRELCK